MILIGDFTFDPRLTLDGLMTLVAGIIAFVAVLLQIRSSGNQIQQQLRADREARIQEEERHKRAVARAILFEILNFYVHYEKYVRPHIEQVDAESCTPPTISAPEPNSFSVYRGNASTLGEFEQDAAEETVRFYGLAQRFLATVEDYSRSLELELQLYKGVGKGSAPRKHLSQMQELMHPMAVSAIDACRKLSGAAGLRFESLRFDDSRR